MSVDRILVIISETGARIVQSALQGIGTQATKTANEVSMLNKALAGVGIAMSAKAAMDMADAWTMAGSKLGSVTRNSQEQAEVQERLFQIANKTTTSFKETVSLYTDLARAGKELGATQNQLLTFTQLVNESLAIHGTNTNTAKGALLQMGQAMTMGKVRAQEWNSMIGGAPGILRAAAENIEGMDGSLAKLRAHMLAGKLTSEQFFFAVLKGGQHINEDFAKFAPTFGRAFVLLENYLIKALGKLNEATGASRLFTNAVLMFGENLPGIISLLMGVGAAALVAFSPLIVGVFANALMALGTVIMAHPLAAILGLSIAVYQFTKDMNAGLDEITTFGDLTAVVMENVGAFITGVGTLFNGVWTDIAEFGVRVWDLLTGKASESTGEWGNDVQGFFSDVGTGFTGFVKGTARFFDALGGQLYKWWNQLIQIFAGMPGVISEAFARAFNFAMEHVENFTNGFIGAYNKLTSIAGAEPISLVNLPRLSTDANAFKSYVADIVQAGEEGWKFQGGALEKAVDGWFKAAEEKAKARKPAVNPFSLDDVLGKATPPIEKVNPPTKPHGLSEAEKNMRELQGVYSMLGQVESAAVKFAKAEGVIYDAFRLGNISAEEKVRVQKLLLEWYLRVSQPVNEFLNKLDKEIALTKMGADERERENAILQETLRWREQGYTATERDIQQMRAKIGVMKEANLIAQARDSIEAGAMKGKEKDFMRQMQAFDEALTRGTIGKAEAGVGAASGAGFDMSLTQESLRLNEEMHAQMYLKIDEMRKRDLISSQTAEALKARTAISARQMELGAASNFFGTLATMQSSKSRTFARIAQAAAIANATIKTYEAANAAYAAMAGIPVVGPALGAAAAGAAIIAGIANVQAIRSQNAGFAAGGYTGERARNSVAGVVHGQEFVVRADMTAKYRDLLEAMNSGKDIQRYVERGYSEGGYVAPTSNTLIPYEAQQAAPKETKPATEPGEKTKTGPIRLQIVNVTDPKLVDDYMNSGEGDVTFVNMIRRNASSVRAAINES